MTTIPSDMLLALDTSSSICSTALFDGAGLCLAQADEDIGRGHAERLVPMIAELLEGRRPDQILVGVGPGSFTGIRVGIAAAHGLAIGWDATILGMSSLALIAAGSSEADDIGVAVTGGHGELFVQQFQGRDLRPTTPVANAAPAAAAKLVTAPTVVGSGARKLVEARGWGEARDWGISASRALRLPELLRTIAPRPVYARPPDARVPEAA